MTGKQRWNKIAIFFGFDNSWTRKEDAQPEAPLISLAVRGSNSREQSR